MHSPSSVSLAGGSKYVSRLFYPPISVEMSLTLVTPSVWNPTSPRYYHFLDCGKYKQLNIKSNRMFKILLIRPFFHSSLLVSYLGSKSLSEESISELLNHYYTSHSLRSVIYPLNLYTLYLFINDSSFRFTIVSGSSIISTLGIGSLPITQLLPQDLRKTEQDVCQYKYLREVYCSHLANVFSITDSGFSTWDLQQMPLPTY